MPSVVSRNRSNGPQPGRIVCSVRLLQAPSATELSPRTDFHILTKPDSEVSTAGEVFQPPTWVSPITIYLDKLVLFVSARQRNQTFCGSQSKLAMYFKLREYTYLSFALGPGIQPFSP